MSNQIIFAILTIHLIISLSLFYKRKRPTYLFLSFAFLMFLVSILLQLYYPNLTFAGRFAFQWTNNAAWVLAAFILVVSVTQKLRTRIQ